MTPVVHAPPAGPGTATFPWLAALAEHGGRTALHTADGPVTYARLAARVGDLADVLAGPRRLVHVRGRTTASSVVGFLAAQAAGHVVLLGADGPAADRVATAYDPDVVLRPDGSVDVVRAEPAHELHPDLALLLSTSGSTGSAKLVRLSTANLVANDTQIRAALGVRSDDCAALTLPLTYCYGLSVLTTHLAVGAAVLLPEASVVDDGFWDAVRRAGVTTFPGVPHTFELLERSGFAERDVPRLRYLTQAGGRMDPERVRRFAELGRRRGWDLVVMYGQCEATARMTYLPPHLVEAQADTVGIPVPGTEIEVVDGEVVFRGDNVMMGYAEGPDDLASGRTVEALHTGDLGELTPEGLLRITGRRSRFVKVHGHRIDLDVLEAGLRREGHDVRCAGRDGLVAVTACGATTAPARELLCRNVTRTCGVPPDAVRVASVPEHPVLGNGKVDNEAVLALADPGRSSGGLGADGPDDPAATPVTDLYAALLGEPVAPASTFASLGGDSLTYVEASVRLEELLGAIPRDWHTTPVGELDAQARARVVRDELTGAADPAGPDGAVKALGAAPASGAWRSSWRRRREVETSVWLRAVGIVLIVGTHAHLFTLQGSANALLVVAGYQLARVQLAAVGPQERARRLGRSALRVAAPAVVAIAGAHLLAGLYEPRNLLLANWLLGEERLGPPWRFWFVEAMVVALLVVAALVRTRAVARLDARFPFGLPLVLAGAALALFRVPWLDLPVPRMQGSALVVLHLVLLGWAVARATTASQRVVVSATVLLAAFTFSFNPSRDALTAGLVLLLVWAPTVRLPGFAVPAVRVLAAASLYVYVMHWQALELTWGDPLLATAASFGVGIAYWWLWTGPATTAARAVAARWRAAARGRSSSKPVPVALRRTCKDASASVR